MARLSRRALLGLAALPMPALAQGFPTRPIRLVVPFPAGGAVDAWARLVAEGMGPRLGQPCIVDNRPGAAGMLGSEAVARAAPDGHTLLFTIDALIQAPIILRRAPYDALRDFTPIGRLGATTLTLTVGDAVPARLGDFAAFLAWARARPRGEPLLLGNWGMGGTGHVLGLLLAQELDLEVTHIGYRGEPPMVSDMLAGRFHGGFVTTLTFGEMIRAGRVRALASAGQYRVPSLADRVPTLQEFGLLQGFDYRAFAGLLAPAGLAPQRLAVLDQAFRETATSEATARALHALDTIPGYAGPAEFGAAIAENAARWGRLAERFALYQDGA